MERKYYLRGLGLGIVVTAVIMGIALAGNKAMTNDEIIARAKELGMVENTVLSGAADAGGENTDEADAAQDVAQDDQDGTQIDVAVAVKPETESETESEADFEAEENTDISDVGEAQEEQGPDIGTDEQESDEPGIVTADDAESGESEEVNEVNKVVTPVADRVITINSGDGSYTVSKKLEDVGVVTSARNFDNFLCQNGYDKRLRTGTFSIPMDASDEQIARIVTGME